MLKKLVLVLAPLTAFAGPSLAQVVDFSESNQKAFIEAIKKGKTKIPEDARYRFGRMNLKSTRRYKNDIAIFYCAYVSLKSKSGEYGAPKLFLAGILLDKNHNLKDARLIDTGNDGATFLCKKHGYADPALLYQKPKSGMAKRQKPSAPLKKTKVSYQARLCEAGLKSLLKAPSTYKRITLYDGYRPKKRTKIMIHYDAANAYGTPIRGIIECEYSGYDSNPFLHVVRLNGKALPFMQKELFDANSGLWLIREENRRMENKER